MCAFPLAVAVSAEPQLPSAVHPDRREYASPDGDVAVDRNPPPLLWPAANHKACYAVRLSQDAAFPPGATIADKHVPWAMFNPHGKLATGTWHWQVGVENEADEPEWSSVHSFVVNDMATVAETPSAREMLDACPRKHPRVLITADALPAFRQHAVDREEAKRIVRNARKALGASLPDENAGVAKRKGENADQAKKFATWASKGLGTRIAGATTLCCQAYLITGDAEFAREAVRKALHVASWDPKGVSSLNDFADGACLRAMALAYDTCYDLLTEEEKVRLRAGIQARAGQFYGRWRNALEGRPFSAHVWQHILNEFCKAAFATLGDIPEAEQWASYVYELWISRFPLMGGADGGWANGSSYFCTNFGTLVEIPEFFQDLTGVDLFTNAWYRNVPYFMMYSWPPGSGSTGFGDGAERQSKPPSVAWLSFLDAVLQHTGDPYGAWYVEACLDGDREALRLESGLAWHRLRTCHRERVIPPPATFDLPQARAFDDIGVVTMHTDLANTDNSLLAAMRSSPYGSFNHAHANQNSFVLLYRGERMFFHTGYYIAYGDPHFKGWYTHTRGHNAILADGHGQKSGTTAGYGWIRRFVDGERIACCTGDASKAYPDAAGLTRWRRHLVLLRPNVVIIYDDLEAERAVEWTWLVHSVDEMEVAPTAFTVTTPKGRGHLDLVGSSPVALSVSTVFDPPADNWRGKRDNDGNVVEYADQWHGSAAPLEKASRMRFLAVIQVQPLASAPPVSVLTANGCATVGGWEIRAELDADRPARLVVGRRDGATALAIDAATLGLGGETIDAGEDVTTLVERIDGELTVRREGDRWPVAGR